MDPAIIASYISKYDFNKIIDLKDILSKTKFGRNGFGGIEIYGQMLKGLPRKDKNWILI